MSSSIIWPAILVTFYFSDSERSAETKAERLVGDLVQHLGLRDGSEGWRGEDAQQQIGYRLRYFTPPAKDVRVVQLVLSDLPEDRAAAVGWQIMLQKLEGLLNDERLGNVFGYTFTYQAVIADPSPPRARRRLFDRLRTTPPPPAPPTFLDLLAAIDLAPLLALTRRLHQSNEEHSTVLAQNVVLNGQGKLYLLNIPTLDSPTSRRHVEKGTVYLALSLASANNEMINQLIYQQSATLFMPDLIAHKGYNQIRQYRLHDKQQKISTQISHLTYSVKQQEKNIQLISDFDKLRISLSRQLYNYEAIQEQGGDAVLDYHRAQLEPRLKELELIVEEGQNMLQAADTAIAIRQARRQWRTELLLAIIGIALALSQLIDQDAALALLHWWRDTLNQSHHERLFALGIQLGITLAIITPIVISWLLLQLIKSAWLALRWLKEFMPRGD